MSPKDVDAAWQQLLEETLPPDKQDALMQTYESETDPRMRYNMLLEFSSYLRQGAAYNEAQRDGGAGKFGHGDDGDDTSLCWEISRVLLIVACILLAILGFAYYVGSLMEPQDPHDMETEL